MKARAASTIIAISLLLPALAGIAAPSRKERINAELKAARQAWGSQTTLTVSPEVDPDNARRILRELTSQTGKFPQWKRHMRKIEVGTNDGMTDGHQAVTWNDGTVDLNYSRYRLSYLRQDRRDAHRLARHEFAHFAHNVLSYLAPEKLKAFMLQRYKGTKQAAQELLAEDYEHDHPAVAKFFQQFRGDGSELPSPG